MSDEYLKGISNADRYIGVILEVLPEECIVIVTSDHGGRAQTHGADCDEDMTIPFIISGGQAAPEQGIIRHSVNITDIAPTITGLLGVEAPSEWVGSAIRFE